MALNMTKHDLEMLSALKKKQNEAKKERTRFKEMILKENESQIWHFVIERIWGFRGHSPAFNILRKAIATYMNRNQKGDNGNGTVI